VQRLDIWCNMSAFETDKDRGAIAVRPQAAAMMLFGGTLFFSALLMFLIQPMFAKLALPRLGGSASVWSLALVFFQAVLLCGYGYAHLLVKGAGLRAGAMIHGAVMLCTMAGLPIAIAPGWDFPPEQGQAFWLLGLFAASVGLPFFAISANAPLLQSWFARSGHARSGDPYFLYGASNAGSFAALLAYPFLIEPFIGLAPQSTLWSGGYAALLFMVAACGALVALAAPAVEETTEAPAPDRVPAWTDRLTWIALSFVPSGLLVGTTAHIATDLVSAPFMWVVPLALYLLTFVITFQRRPWLSHDFVINRLLAIMAPVCILVLMPFTDMWLVPVHLLASFTLMMACHGELVRRRPAERHLPQLYFLMSLGGVLGGSFASLAAPVIFDRVLEYPLLIAAAFAVVGLTRQSWKVSGWRFWVAVSVIPGTLILLLILGGADSTVTGYAIAIWLLWSIVTILALSGFQLVQAIVLLSVILVYPSVSLERHAIAQSRSFFGVSSVYRLEAGRFHVLAHGTTRHGTQEWIDNNGLPVSANPQPQSYYYARGPFGSAINHLRSIGGKLSEVAIVGLGTGTMSCHANPGENWSYFEIDPGVVKIARNAELFTYLRDCAPGGRIVMGDGRLRLQREADGKYDLIILDAFSSDSVPAHLLTVEALELYLAKLKPNGAVILHISNRFMELAGVVEGAARAKGLRAYFNTLDVRHWAADASLLDIRPHVAVIGKSPEALGGLPADPGWAAAKPEDVPAAWTDDFSNVLGAIWRRFTGG
jgi:hypothetical protein